MSKILSATTELLEYSIKAQPNPTAILVPIRDSITASIIDACYDLSFPAHKIAKLSGIGC